MKDSSEKVGNVQECEQRNRNSKKPSREMLEIKYSVTQMKNALGGLTDTLDTADGRISETKMCQKKWSKLKCKEKKKRKQKKRIFSNCGTITKSITCV